MFNKIKNFLGYGQNVSVQDSGPEESVQIANRLNQDLLDLLDAAKTQTDDGISISSEESSPPIDTSAAPANLIDPEMRKAWVRNNPYPTLTRVWYGLRSFIYQLQQGARWILEKAFNTAFYLVAFNIAIALFARTIGFLAAGSFGWAALTLIPAFIAFRSTGPLSDFLSKVATTIVPPVFSGLFYVVKAIASKVLAHCLRVTGIADYAKTVNPGEFFGKAKLPVVKVGTNRDDEVDPNPDLTTNAAVYGPDINLGPFSLGTSIRANWSIVKYIKNLPQYIKHGLNWAMKKSGLEDFARNVDTPLKRQEREDLISIDEELAKFLLSELTQFLPENKKPQPSDVKEQLQRITKEIAEAKMRIAAANKNGRRVGFKDRIYAAMTTEDINYIVNKRLSIAFPQVSIDDRFELVNKRFHNLKSEPISNKELEVKAKIERHVSLFNNKKNIPASDLQRIILLAQKKQNEYIEAMKMKYIKAERERDLLYFNEDENDPNRVLSDKSWWEEIHSQNMGRVINAAILVSDKDLAVQDPKSDREKEIEKGTKAKIKIDTYFNMLVSVLEKSSDVFVSAFDKAVADHPFDDMIQFLQENEEMTLQDKILHATEKHKELINQQIQEDEKALQSKIDTYVSSLINDMPDLDLESFKELAQNGKPAADKFWEAYNEKISKAWLSVTLINDKDFNLVDCKKAMEEGVLAKREIDQALSNLKRDIAAFYVVFKPAFDNKVKEVAPEIFAPKNSILNITLPANTPEQQAEYEAVQKKYRENREARELLFQQRREKSNATWNFAPAKTASQVALEQEAESRRLQQEDEERRPKFGTQQTFAGGRNYAPPEEKPKAFRNRFNSQ